MGKRLAWTIGSIVKRTTRSLFLAKYKAKETTSVRKEFTRKLKTLPEQIRLSMTYERSKEMAKHELFIKSTKMQMYFSHPQNPWEWGTNKNTNLLIRQILPKGTEFSKVT